MQKPQMVAAGLAALISAASDQVAAQENKPVVKESREVVYSVACKPAAPRYWMEIKSQHTILGNSSSIIQRIQIYSCQREEPRYFSYSISINGQMHQFPDGKDEFAIQGDTFSEPLTIVLRREGQNLYFNDEKKPFPSIYFAGPLTITATLEETSGFRYRGKVEFSIPSRIDDLFPLFRGLPLQKEQGR